MPVRVKWASGLITDIVEQVAQMMIDKPYLGPVDALNKANDALPEKTRWGPGFNNKNLTIELMEQILEKYGAKLYRKQHGLDKPVETVVQSIAAPVAEPDPERLLRFPEAPLPQESLSSIEHVLADALSKIIARSIGMALTQVDFKEFLRPVQDVTKTSLAPVPIHISPPTAAPQSPVGGTASPLADPPVVPKATSLTTLPTKPPKAPEGSVSLSEPRRWLVIGIPTHHHAELLKAAAGRAELKFWTDAGRSIAKDKIDWTEKVLFQTADRKCETVVMMLRMGKPYHAVNDGFIHVKRFVENLRKSS